MSGAHLFASGGPYKRGGTLAAHDTTSFDFFSSFLPCSIHSTEVGFSFLFRSTDRLRPRRRKRNIQIDSFGIAATTPPVQFTAVDRGLDLIYLCLLVPCLK
jgi:hypothetical protein